MTGSTWIPAREDSCKINLAITVCKLCTSAINEIGIVEGYLTHYVHCWCLRLHSVNKIHGRCKCQTSTLTPDITPQLTSPLILMVKLRGYASLAIINVASPVHSISAWQRWKWSQCL